MGKILPLASTVALLAGLVTAARADIPVGLATATTGPVAATLPTGPCRNR
jgi:hypothetical protein